MPYTRPFLYPNLAAPSPLCTPIRPSPARRRLAQGNNFSNYHSAAQREDALTYAQYDWNVMPRHHLVQPGLLSP